MTNEERNYTEAVALFQWLGFQLSDDNDCHRFPGGPVAHIKAILDAAGARGETTAAQLDALVSSAINCLPFLDHAGQRDTPHTKRLRTALEPFREKPE